MLKLNLVDKGKSDISYEISRFPDGEIQITLGEFSHKSEINVQCRITTADELFILMQVCDILARHDVQFSISIYYLMGMRMDRVMDFNRPFTLKVIVGILDNLGATDVSLFCPHSERGLDLFKKTDVYKICSDEWETFNDNLAGYQTVLPDAGAVDRYYYIEPPADVIVGEKVRDVATGKILSIKVKNPEAIDGRPLLLIDDLCDGGGTFVGLAAAIREIDPDAKISIVVNHMVNHKGIQNLSKNFDHVWFSNSYCDWESGYKVNGIKFPENITQINVI